MTKTVQPLSGDRKHLEDLFTFFLADVEFGVFAIGIDQNDPSFAEGGAMLFSGDDGTFRAISPRLDAAYLGSLADVCAGGEEALGRIFHVRELDDGRSRRIELKDWAAQEVPDAMPLSESIQHHRGFLAGNYRFGLIAAPYKGNHKNATLNLMMADPVCSVWRKIEQFSVHRLRLMAEVLASAALIATPDPKPKRQMA